jgi:hypothetical protein
MIKTTEGENVVGDAAMGPITGEEVLLVRKAHGDLYWVPTVPTIK